MSQSPLPSPLQPYQPQQAARRPGPGALIGGIIAILAIGMAVMAAAGLILTGLHAGGALVAWITRAALLAVLVVIALYVRRWLWLRQPGAVRHSRRELPALLIFCVAAGGMLAVFAAAAIAGH